MTPEIAEVIPPTTAATANTAATESSSSTNNIPSIEHKLNGYDFYHKILKSPKYVVAPMVDQSELAWRMLCRKYGAQLCYSPMYHSNLLIHDIKYRKDALQTCAGDRPLIIQLCGNEAQIILEAALIAQEHCDAIDINLGCPQAIAKRGHYGAFLQDEWGLLQEIVQTLHKRLSVPVTCKIRIFEDRQRTIKYAQMLEAAGCQLLTVHGRTREQKGPLTGVADWSYIREVRQNIKIPMFANGNILCLEDIERCVAVTLVDGVMTAEGNLHNPALFTGTLPTTWSMAEEYLEFVQLYPCPTSYIRGHLFKIFHHLMNLASNAELREQLAVSSQLSQFRAVVQFIRDKYEPYHNGLISYENKETDTYSYNLSPPPWLCQPYVRIPPEEHKQIIAEKLRLAEDPNRDKRKYFDAEGNEISRKRMKRLRRRQRRPRKSDIEHERNHEHCDQCHNPMGLKCSFRLCRVCCRSKCYSDTLDCTGHGILIKYRRSKTNLTDVGNCSLNDDSGVAIAAAVDDAESDNEDVDEPSISEDESKINAIPS